jgi:hypothetical protein
VRRRGTLSRKPAKTQRRKPARPKRTRAAMAASQTGRSVSDLQEQLERQARELAEARDERTAIAEVLSAISNSRGDVESVFQAILDHAVRICGAKFGTIFRFDGEAFYFAAEVGTPPEYVEFQRQRGSFLPSAAELLNRVFRTRQVIHSADLIAEAPETPGAKLNAEMAFIFRRQDEVYRLAANCGFPPAYEAFLKGVALPPSRTTVTGRAALEGHPVHVVDILADPAASASMHVRDKRTAATGSRSQ